MRDLTAREWQQAQEYPVIRQILSRPYSEWLAQWCGMTVYEAQECCRRLAARKYLCATGECWHADANRPARGSRLSRVPVAA
jgi:hypothetical protein